MSNQREQAEKFHGLHQPGSPLVLYNIWDAGTALAAQKGVAPALATGSWSVAKAHGREDGQDMPLEWALANLERIIASVDLPVSVDIEAGYGAAPDAVAQTVAQVIERGAVGINLEDQVIGEDSLFDREDQSERIAAARAAADGAGIPLFINARTDVFFQPTDTRPLEDKFQDCLARAEAYRLAGCSGLFVPGLTDSDLIGALVEQADLPVNVMLLPDLPTADKLAELGVARISQGPAPYLAMMARIEAGCRKLYR